MDPTVDEFCRQTLRKTAKMRSSRACRQGYRRAAPRGRSARPRSIFDQQLAVSPIPELSEKLGVDRVRQKPGRAVSECKHGPALMETAETTHVQ